MWKTKKMDFLDFFSFFFLFWCKHLLLIFFRTISYAQFHKKKENISSLKCSIKLSLCSFSFFWSDVVSQNLGIVRVSLKKNWEGKISHVQIY